MYHKLSRAVSDPLRSVAKVSVYLRQCSCTSTPPLTCDDLPGAVGVGGQGEEEGRGSFLPLRVAVLGEHGQTGGERRSFGEP